MILIAIQEHSDRHLVIVILMVIVIVIVIVISIPIVIVRVIVIEPYRVIEQKSNRVKEYDSNTAIE